MKISLNYEIEKKGEDTFFWDESFSSANFEEKEIDKIELYLNGKNYRFDKSELLKLLKALTL